MQSNKLLVRILCAPQLTLSDQLHDALPYNRDHLTLILGVSTPVNPDERDVLEQDLVHSDLFDAASSKTNNENASVPGCALGGLVNKADGIVDDVDTTILGRQSLDLGRPVSVVVGDNMVGTERLCDLEFAWRGGCSDDGGAECFCDWRIVSMRYK